MTGKILKKITLSWHLQTLRSPLISAADKAVIKDIDSLNIYKKLVYVSTVEAWRRCSMMRRGLGVSICLLVYLDPFSGRGICSEQFWLWLHLVAFDGNIFHPNTSGE